MDLVANLQYDDSGGNQEGSDIEFVSTRGHDYALAGTLSKGLRIIDITDPTAPVEAGHYDCPIYQGDVQVWTKKNRIYASYTADRSFGDAAQSQCGRDLGVYFQQAGTEPTAAIGTVIVDLSNPKRPATVSFLPIPRGSHNMTIHPSGDYLYNSNSDLATSTRPTIEVWNVADPARPHRAAVLELPYTPTSLGSESHDVTFNADGTRAYSAAISQSLVIDTTDPADPAIVSKIVDPSINVAHQADPVTMTRADGTERELLIVTDEVAGATDALQCPGGGLHVYDITGAHEKAPVKVGTWFIEDTSTTTGVCTSHVLRIYPEQEMLTIAWYAAGVHVLDISGLADVETTDAPVAFGDGVGMTSVGSYKLPDSDTWSFKTNRIEADGSFYGYGNDLVRGFDVYHYDGTGVDAVAPLVPEQLLTEEEPSTSPAALATPAAAGVGLAVLIGLRRWGRRRAEG